ncbi:PepSY-associated TM helix domain-containing protein [Hydrogenophaga sp.]|uniref:PepSY-associated TM helix domain-containing protein n=1 Tax=Hydrogenophaga sp. TaxID=1904254 RepID=UPI002FC6F07A
MSRSTQRVWAARVAVAVLGSYGLAALVSVAALALPGRTIDGVVAGMLISFAVASAVAVVVFAARAGARGGVRPRVSWLHTWAGLLAAWVLYTVFWTGSLAFYREELTAWMQPEAPPQARQVDVAALSDRIAAHLTEAAPGATRWSIELPDVRRLTPTAYWSGPDNDGAQAFDSLTGAPRFARATAGGEFFYRFHYQLHHLPYRWGRWIVGIAALLGLVAMVSGVVVHRKLFADFFTFRAGKGRRSWLDAHNALSVLPLPFHFMIVYSGLVILGFQYMPWGALAAFDGADKRRAAIAAETVATWPAGTPSGQAAPLAPLAPLLRQAEQRWGGQGVDRVVVHHPGDTAARVLVVRGSAGRVTHSREFLLFDGHSGALLQASGPVGTPAAVLGGLYALHLGRFADPVLQAICFLLGLAGTAMVGTGLVLWTAARGQAAGPRFVARGNVAVLAGLLFASAAYLWANRLLPVDVPLRPEVEIRCFFAAWAMALGIACLLRPARAWPLLWSASALAFGALPLLNVLTTQRPFWRSLATGDAVFVGVDLACAALSACLCVMAVHAQRRATRPP